MRAVKIGNAVIKIEDITAAVYDSSDNKTRVIHKIKDAIMPMYLTPNEEGDKTVEILSIMNYVE